MFSTTPYKPTYIIASNFIETCIFDLTTSQIAFLPKKLPLSLCNRRLCNSRNFFKSIRDLYYPVTVSSIVLPYTDNEKSETKLSIIQNGKSFGYKNTIQLCSFETAAAIRALSSANLEPEESDICIFIFHMETKICATILQFNCTNCWVPLKYFMAPVNLRHDELRKFCHNLIVSAPPSSKLHTFVIAYTKEMLEARRLFFVNLFKENVLHFIDFEKPDEFGLKGFLGGFLIKAQILAGFEVSKKCNVSNVSDWNFKACVNGKDIFKFDSQFKELPFKEEKKLEICPGTLFEV